ncbi:MAG: hypothetical protein Q8L05_02780, partial [Actinomycetota bacterium]|nr:hypothetical protein [Actinomycetota bacterium]
MSDPDALSTQAPDVPHKGLNVVDFKSPGVVPSVRRAVRLLPPGKRRLLYVAAAIQISLGLLDLLGIALIGLLAAVAVSGITVANIPDWLADFLGLFGVENPTVSQVSVFIALSAVFIL